MGPHEGAFVDHLLFNEKVPVGAGRYLRRMGDGQNLHLAGQPRQSPTNGVGNGTARSRLNKGCLNGTAP